MKPPPKVRKDKRCVTCGGRRKLPSRLQKGVGIEVYEQDPFCKTECAKAYYEVPVRTGERAAP